MPVYDDRGRIIGRFSSSQALASITESIARILSESSMFDNGFSSVFTPDSDSLGPFGSVIIAQTNLIVSGLAMLTTVRLTDQGLEASAPVHVAAPPGHNCLMCPPGLTACASNTCSVSALRALCPSGPLLTRQTPKGPEFTCIVELEGALEMASAAQRVKAAVGSFCPPDRHEFEFGSSLVDVTPFYAEEYGLPGLAPPGYWCQLTVIPRRNVYKSTDEAKDKVAIVVSVSVTGIALGVLLMLWALWLVRRAHAKLRRGRRRHEEGHVHEAISLIETLQHPMVLVPAELFVGFGELPMHDKLRDDQVGKRGRPRSAVNSCSSEATLRAGTAHHHQRPAGA